VDPYRALVLAGVGAAYAQATASISGVVKGRAGGVVPGVTVVVKDDGRRSQEAVTDSEGPIFRSGAPGRVYTVTASLTGFKSAEAKGVAWLPVSR